MTSGNIPTLDEFEQARLRAAEVRDIPAEGQVAPEPEVIRVGCRSCGSTDIHQVIEERTTYAVKTWTRNFIEETATDAVQPEDHRVKPVYGPIFNRHVEFACGGCGQRRTARQLIVFGGGQVKP